MGDFFANLLGPVLDRVKTIIEPVRPVIEMLQKPIPVVSTLDRKSVV